MKQEEIKPGTILHTEKPFVHILNSKLRSERCDNCLEKKKLQQCSGCHYVHYCGRHCQKESWIIHKKECKNLKRISPKVVPDAARLMSRIIIKLQNGGDLEKGFYKNNNITSFRKFRDLMNHYTDIKKDENRTEHFISLCGVLAEYLHDVQIPNSCELVGIYGRMCVNGFNILDPEMTSIGTGIYLGASVIDHSCEPNAVAVFEGTTIYIRALETLPSIDWKKIFISYIDLLDTPEDRQKSLQKNYYFLCQCSLCLDVNQLKYINSGVCSNQKCKSLVDMNKNNENKHCENCHELITEEYKNEYKNVEEFTLCHLENMANMAYLDVCKMCLKKQKDIFHSLNLLHVKTLDQAFESSIQMEYWDEAEKLGVSLLSGYRKYYGKFHPLLGLLLLKIGKIMIYKGKIKEANKYLQEAEEIISITHGKIHSFYKETLIPLLHQASVENIITCN